MLYLGHIFLQMTDSIQSKIEAKIKSMPKGSILFPSSFESFGNVEIVKKSLHRLEKKSFIRRIAHGIYLYPKKDKHLGELLPTIEEVAKAIAKRDKAKIIPTGIAALNQLGLSTQVPMKTVYLTNGAPRSVKIGKRTIKFKRTTPKVLAAKGEITCLIIQALKEIGKGNASEAQLEKIKGHLKREKKENIEHDAKLASAWIAKIITTDLL